MNNNDTKKSLKSSVAVLFLCVVLLIGTTFAWFTDSVSSGTNKIQAGNLDVTLEKLDTTQNKYVDVSDKAVFEGNLWEPGYTDAAAFKVGNDGSLALKYEIDIIAKTADANELAKVIDVYYFDGENTAITALPDSFATIKNGWTKVGTLEEILANGTGAAKGNLEAGQADYAGIALHMREDAGNEYQGKSAAFDISLKATQDTVESDSFDNQYDKDVVISSQSAAVDTLKDETTKDVVIDTDITISQSTERFNISSDKNIDFRNKTITRESGTGGGLLIGEKGYSAYPVNVTIENANFVSEASSAAVRVESGSTVAFKNVSFKGSEAIQIYNTGAKTTLVFENCTFDGTASLDSGDNPGEYDVIFRDCTFKGTFGNGGASVDIGPHAYGNITFDGCNIDITRNGNAVSGIDIGSYDGSNGNNSITVNLNNTDINVNAGTGTSGVPVSINTKDITTLNITGDCTFTYDGVEKTFNTASKTWQ